MNISKEALAAVLRRCDFCAKDHVSVKKCKRCRKNMKLCGECYSKPECVNCLQYDGDHR